MLDGRLVDHLFQRVRKILQNDNGRSTRVLELMLQLACRVERIDIHTGVASSKDPSHRHGKLRDIGQHDGHTSARLQPLLLQPRTQGGRQLVQLCVAHPTVHAVGKRTMRVLLEGFLHQVSQRPILLRMNLMGDAVRVTLEPDFFHCKLLRPIFRRWQRQS